MRCIFGHLVMERAIIEALKSAYGNRNVKFQVTIQNGQLYVYLNHRQDDRPNYLLLEETVAAAISSLDLAAIDEVWLYCRPQGQVTPDWQTSVEFKLGINTDEIETIGTTESQIIADNSTTVELSSASTTENYPIYPIASDPNAITDIEVQTEWENKFAPDDDSTDLDTGLLHHVGLTHSSNLEETEIDSVLDAIETEISDPQPEPDNELAQYCLVSNRQLLTSDLIAPGKEIIRLVKFFHHLDDRSQFKLLPILTTYFQQGITDDLKNLSLAVQKWFKQIKELNYDDQQTLAIWLSRYCFNPNATLEEFKAINARQAEQVKTKQANYRHQAHSYTPVKNKGQRSQPPDTPSKISKRFSFKKLLLPTAWVLATVILLIVTIADRSPNATADQIPTLCRDTIGSPEYCRLAVNLAGSKAIAKSPQSSYPLTQLTETVASYGCQRYANLKAEIASDLTPEQAPARSSYGEKIFPHIYLVRVMQKNAVKEGSTQVGCVYTTGRGQRSPKLLAADVIPTNWPTEPYQNEVDANLSSYTAVPLSLGLHTIFAAIGIAIASWLNLSIKVNRAATVYLAALVLGILQLLAGAVPVFGSLARITLPILAIFALNQLLEGFEVSHKHGVAAIAISMLTIVLVQLILYSLTLSSIGSLV